MNKKKSKALAFLLAASLLVPSANGIVSAAELRGNDVVAVEQAEGTGDSSTSGTETTETVNPLDVKSEEDLKGALEKKEVKEIVITQGFEVKNTINVSKAGVTIKGADGVTLTGTSIFKITANATISNLVFNNTQEDAGNVINITSGATANIEGCKFIGKKVINLIDCSSDSKLKFIGNTVELIARSMIVGVTNGSEIIGNTIDLQGERYSEGDGMRTGVLSVIAYGEVNEQNKVNIEGNTFRNANRVIGMDNGNVKASNMNIKNNKFIDCRFAVEVDPNGNNKGQEYNLENNYFEFGGKVSALKVQDAGKRDKKNDYAYIHEGNSAELVLSKDDKIVNVYPYYSEIDKSGNIVESSKVEKILAKVGDKSFESMSEAISAAKSDKKTIVLQRDFELREKINIANGENITITSSNKSIIDLMDTDLINIAQGGSLTLQNVELRANKNTINYITRSGDLTIDHCDITATKNVQGITNIVKGGTETNDIKFILTNSNVSVNARGGFVAVGAGSVIENNIIDLKGIDGEKASTDGGRVGIISLTSMKKDGTVRIENNTFMNANRAIGVDHSNIEDENLSIKYNIFKDVRFALELDPTKDINQSKSYDLSKNYFEFNKKVSAPKVQDAHARDKDKEVNKNHNGDFTYDQASGNSTELVLNDYKDESFAKDLPSLKVEPYYIDKDKTQLSDGSHKPSVPSTPSKPSKPVYTHEEIIGSDRYDTAAKIADKLGSYDTVVLVNATSTMSDGLSASGLAGKENGAILLTKKDSIPKVTMDRIKKVKKVYIIGGESAISAKVAKEITAANIKVERLGGKTRVETSELVAKKLGNYNKAFVVNGFKGEADAMSASAVAAKNGAPILLTNGKSSTHAKKAGVEYYVIGGNTVVDKSIVSKYDAERLAGSDRYATNREVMDEFYSGKEKVYIANGDKLVDALTASPLAKNNGIVLVNKKSDKSILKGKDTVQVGGMDFEIDFE